MAAVETFTNFTSKTEDLLNIATGLCPRCERRTLYEAGQLGLNTLPAKVTTLSNLKHFTLSTKNPKNVKQIMLLLSRATEKPSQDCTIWDKDYTLLL